MHDPKRFKLYALSIKGPSESWWKSGIGTLFLAIIIYLAIGAESLLRLCFSGEEIVYMPFWHAPWRFILNLVSNFI